MKKMIKRVLALLLVISFLALIVLTLYLAITGSPYFMASLFTMIVYPCFVYVVIWLQKVFGE